MRCKVPQFQFQNVTFNKNSDVTITWSIKISTPFFICRECKRGIEAHVPCSARPSCTTDCCVNVKIAFISSTCASLAECKSNRESASFEEREIN